MEVNPSPSYDILNLSANNLKRVMKKIIICCIAATTLLASCKPDACEDVNCSNGICDDGNCFCDVGFEGANCDTEERQKFIAEYTAEENCNPGDFDYDISITANPTSISHVTVSNLGDFNFDIEATVDGTDISIDSESNGYTVVGSGMLSNGLLTLEYTLTTSAQQTLTCTVVCTES